MTRRATMVIGALLLCACEAFVEDPIAAGVDSPDKDVSEYLEKVLRSAQAMPDSAAMRGRLAMAYDINGLRDAALATYAQAEALDGQDFRWPYFSAVLLAEAGDAERALVILQRALEIDEDYAPAWLWRGTWLLEAGRLEEAARAFEKAADGAGPAARFGRARVLMAKEVYQTAIELLEPLAEGTGHPFIYRTLGEALRAVGRAEEARSALARGKDAVPLTWPDARRDERNAHVRGYASYQLAQNLSAAGRMNEALAIIARLQRHHPEAACGNEEDFFLACNLMNSKSIAEDRSGYPEKAQAILQKGLSLNPKFTPFHLTMANLYRRQGELERALDHVDKAIALNPARGFAHEQRGRLLFGLGRFDEAKAAFETALEYESEKQSTLFYLGLAEVELENWTAAHARFERLTQTDPGFALGHAFLARSLAELGDVAGARAVQDRARQLGASPAELRATETRLSELEAP